MRKPARERASIRTRLILVPLLVSCIGLFAAVAVTLFAARARIEAETLSGVELAELVIRYALADLDSLSDPEAALQRLQADLAKVRHVRVHYEPRHAPAAPALEADAAPWAAGFLAPEPIVERYLVTIGGEPHGTLVIATRPADEAAEIWGSLSFLTTLLAAIAAAIAIAILVTARRTSKPLAELVEGLRRLRQGRFEALSEIEVAELQEIGARFNELAASLDRTRADNRLLVDRLMAIEDSERAALARELHDEFGAALFGIRAAASCIQDRARSGAIDKAAAEIATRAETISRLAETLQQHSRTMLERVRPQVLQRLGLAEALQDLVEQWRATHRDTACDLSLPTTARPVDAETAATIYRLVQEGLTNVARHAGAHRASVTLDFAPDPSSGRPSIGVAVEDDGAGLPADFRFGFGLLGMTERVRKLGGRLNVARGAEAGTRIEAVLPHRAGHGAEPAAAAPQPLEARMQRP